MKEGLIQFKVHISESHEVIINVTVMKKLLRERLQNLERSYFT